MYVQVGKGLVELVDTGEFNSEKAADLVSKYIKPMLANNVDHIILGCTHYPFLKHHIEKVTNKRVVIVDPAPAVAIQTRKVLDKMGLAAQENNLTTQKYVFYTTGNPAILKNILKKLVVGDFEINKIA